MVHHVSRVPVVLPCLCLIEVAIDTTSLHFIPCSSQEERTAKKQQSRSPHSKEKGSVCFPQKMVKFEHAVKALAISHNLHFCTLMSIFPNKAKGEVYPELCLLGVAMLILICAWWVHYLRLQRWLSKMTYSMLFSQQKIPLGVRSVRNVSLLSTLWQKKEAGIRRGKNPSSAVSCHPIRLAALGRSCVCSHWRAAPRQSTHTWLITHMPQALQFW